MPRSVPLFVLVLVIALVLGVPTLASPSGVDRESPTVSDASTCYISQQCPGGGQVSCSGPAGTCSSGSNWVECDGDRHVCSPPCEAQITCAYGGMISCDSSQTPSYHYCEEGSDYVYCEGAGTLTCDQCSPAIWCHIP